MGKGISIPLPIVILTLFFCKEREFDTVGEWPKARFCEHKGSFLLRLENQFANGIELTLGRD